MITETVFFSLLVVMAMAGEASPSTQPSIGSAVERQLWLRGYREVQSEFARGPDGFWRCPEPARKQIAGQKQRLAARIQANANK